jgi:hypothetical protein
MIRESRDGIRGAILRQFRWHSANHLLFFGYKEAVASSVVIAKDCEIPLPAGQFATDALESALLVETDHSNI